VSTFLDWLDVHGGAVIALATVVLVIVTTVYVWLTRRMVAATIGSPGGR
jgi:hypothetical protein